VDGRMMAITKFANNEAYGGLTGTGLVIYSLNTDKFNVNPNAAESVVKDFHVWNVYDKAYYNYETNMLTFDGLVARGDFSLLRGDICGATALYSGDYVQYNFTVENSDIQGFYIGFNPAVVSNIGFGQRIINSYMRNYIDIHVTPEYETGDPRELPSSRTTTIDNVRFDPIGMPDHSDWGAQAYIWMDGNPVSKGTNFITLDVVYVYNFNGVSGDNFQAYYLEQAANAVLPQTV